MVDTLRPAVDALKTAYVDEKMAPKEAMKKALEVGEAGSDATIPIIAKKAGRCAWANGPSAIVIPVQPPAPLFWQFYITVCRKKLKKRKANK